MNNKNIRTVDRSRYLLAVCIGVVKNFSFNVGPYKEIKKPMIPTQVMLQQEILRRSPGHRIRKMRNSDLVDLLNSEELMVGSEVDKEYLISSKKRISSTFSGTGGGGVERSRRTKRVKYH